MIGIRILKIDAEMAEIIEFKDGTCNFEINILPSLVGRFRGVQLSQSFLNFQNSCINVAEFLKTPPKPRILKIDAEMAKIIAF